jgi:DNA invertase Pin-like site-specific DNA recombinase
VDRLGRNTRDVLNLVHELEEKGASPPVLEPAIDTGGPMGRMGVDGTQPRFGLSRSKRP